MSHIRMSNDLIEARTAGGPTTHLGEERRELGRVNHERVQFGTQVGDEARRSIRRGRWIQRGRLHQAGCAVDLTQRAEHVPDRLEHGATRKQRAALILACESPSSRLESRLDKVVWLAPEK